MSLEEILRRERSKWMETSGPASDIALSSRVRVARNIGDAPFPPRLDSDGARRVVEAATEALPLLNQRLKRSFELFHLRDLSPLDRRVLVEKHLVSPMLAQNDAGALILSDDEAVSVMMNEEDHVRIQCLMPGLQLEEAWRVADAVDDGLASVVDYAFDDRYGYLTTCPTNLGTGLRVSVMMHLPAMSLANQAGRVLGTLPKVGAVVRGMYGEGSEAQGNLYQVSNQVTLGRAEQEIIEDLQSVGRQLIDRERSARELLTRDMKEQLDDRVCRAYGLLTNARVMTSDEALGLLSDLRLGIDLSVIPHVPAQVFSDLIVATRPGFLQKLAERDLSPGERDKRRATLIRHRLQKG